MTAIQTDKLQDSVQPLAKVKVLEIANSPGACFAASMLADFGASVHVCEAPPAGSMIRAMIPSDWWYVLARNKTSMAIDPAAPGGAEVVRSLFSKATVVVTDVAPRDRQHHLWLREISRIDEKPLIVYVFPAGADRPDLWPWSRRADLTAAVTGLMALTGHQNQSPIQPEFPLAEYLSGAMAALRTVAELRRFRMTGGPAADVIMPLHAAAQRMIEWQVPMATVMGRPELRDGNAFPMSYSISNMFRTREGKYLAVSAASQPAALRLMEMIGGPELSQDPRFSTIEARRIGGLTELYKIIAKWMLERPIAEIRTLAAKHDVVLGPVYDVEDIIADEQFKARGNIVHVPVGNGRTVPMPAILPSVVGWRSSIRNAGPLLGADTEAVLADFDFSPERIERLRVAQIIWNYG